MKKILVIYHKIDIDGWLSAAICKMFLENADFIGYDYGDPIPDTSGYTKIYVCDISLPNMDERFIWLDHHISAINKYPKDIRGRRDTYYSACELTWMFFSGKSVPQLITYAGMYDSFRHVGTQFEKDVFSAQYGLRSGIYDMDSAKLVLEAFLNGMLTIDDLIIQGRIIVNYLNIQAKNSYKKVHPLYLEEPIYNNGEYVETRKWKFAAINEERMNFANFGIDYCKDGYDGVLSYHFADGVWIYSIYSCVTCIDCSAIASRYGGGGHKGAAGFRLNEVL